MLRTRTWIQGPTWRPRALASARHSTTDQDRTIEAYLLNFSGDIYGQTVCLEFVRRLRGEEKFDTVAALLNQMNMRRETD